MDYPNHTTNPRKHKHLNFEELMTIQIRLKDGYSPYKIAKELGRASNTIRNEISRATITQIKQDHKISTFNIASIATLNLSIYLVMISYPMSVR